MNYLSPWLRGMVDSFAAFNELELLSNYLDPTARLPKPILAKIDARIEELTRLESSHMSDRAICIPIIATPHGSEQSRV